MILLTAGAISSTGCVHQREHDLRRVWCDWNTLGEPAFFLEQKDHKPYDAARVGNFRWAYGKDPGHQYYFPYYISAEELAAQKGSPFFGPALPSPALETTSKPPVYFNDSKSLPITKKATPKTVTR